MINFTEMNKKVQISVGLLIAIIVVTFIVTRFYIKQDTMEMRMDKRYDRVMEEIHIIQKDIKDLQKKGNKDEDK